MNTPNRMLLSLLAVALAGMMLAAEGRVGGVGTSSEARARGQAIVVEAFGVLSGSLSRAIAEGGSTNAIQFCSVNAASLAGRVAQTNHVVLKRVSHKARNPGNRANAEELLLLDGFRSALKESTAIRPEVRTNNAGHLVFYAPIVLNNPVCLNCHGDPKREVAADTMAVIRKLYPEDQATGFKLGDLRGLWRVEFLR